MKTVETKTEELTIETGRILDWGITHGLDDADTLTIVVGDVTFREGVTPHKVQTKVITKSMAEVAAALAAGTVTGFTKDITVLHAGLKGLLYKLAEPIPEPEPKIDKP